jgi:hypothetical protein
MPAGKKQNKEPNRTDILRSVTTPLGFYVLTLLIVEALLTLVLTCSKLTEEHQWEGLIGMFAAFACFVLIVTILTVFFPKNLLYGKEEHLAPPLDLAALEDQIEELIVKNVKPEYLKEASTRGMIK